MKEWFTSYFLVLASLDKTLAQFFCFLGFSFDFWDHKLLIFCQYNFLYPYLDEQYKVENNSSYSAWLLVVENSKHMYNSIIRTIMFFKVKLDPLLQILDDPYVNITQVWAGSGVPRVNCTMKFITTMLFLIQRKHQIQTSWWIILLASLLDPDGERLLKL